MNAYDQMQRFDGLNQPLGLGQTRFPPNSRYFGNETIILDPEGEHPVIYLRRRIVPHPEDLSWLRDHVVTATERPDHIAAQEFGDPELFWRLCDANRAIFADELVAEPGRHLRITMPQGVPGARDE